jgi:hypothetical protein
MGVPRSREDEKMRVTQRLATVLLAGTMSLSLCVAASAQKGQKGQPGQKRAAAAVVAPALLSKLDLTGDQQVKIKAATATLQEERKKAQGLSTPKEKKQANQQALQAYQATLKSTLTAEQQQRLAQMMAQAREYKGMGPMGNQLVGIDLSDEQKQKIQAIGARYEPELTKLRQSVKESNDKKAVRGQMQDLNRKMMAEIKAVLTPEQQKSLAPAGRAKKTKA